MVGYQREIMYHPLAVAPVLGVACSTLNAIEVLKSAQAFGGETPPPPLPTRNDFVYIELVVASIPILFRL